jgi:hypothetical protein
MSNFLSIGFLKFLCYLTHTGYIFSPTLQAKKVFKKQVWLCGTSFHTNCFVKDFLCFKHFFDTKLDPSNDLQVWYGTGIRLNRAGKLFMD